MNKAVPGTKYAIAYVSNADGTVKIAHYFDPGSGISPVWTDAFGTQVEAPEDIGDWTVA